MTKRIKLISILLSVALVAGILASIGLTAAIWTSPGEGETSEDAGTSVTSEDWNVWAKYFSYQPAIKADGEEDASNIMLTEFHYSPSNDGQEIGFNHHRLIIPRVINGKNVTQISGSVFSDTVLKEMVEELYIPNTVTYIAANAFSGLTNLVKLEFEGDSNDLASAPPCDLQGFAFAGCTSLGTVITNERKLNDIDGLAFFGSNYKLPTP